MNLFPKFTLFDALLNEAITLAAEAGNATQAAILDDGWSPHVAAYVRDRDADNVYSDVVEELECITNVATRDAALQLIERINAMIRRAAHYAQTYQRYYVRLDVRTQFSTSTDSSAWIAGPPDDGEVIKLSTDIQTAPAGQVRFQLRFRRKGLWQNRRVLRTAATVLPRIASAVYTAVTSLYADPVTVTPTSQSVWASDLPTVNVNDMYILTNVGDVIATEALIGTMIGITITTVSPLLYAQSNNVARITYQPGGVFVIVQLPILLVPGTYAVFATCQPRATYSSHYISLSGMQGGNDVFAYITADDVAVPEIAYFGTITITAPTQRFLTNIRSDAAGIDIDQFIFVRLFDTSTIIHIPKFTLGNQSYIRIANDTEMIQSALFRDSYIAPRANLSSSDSVNVVLDRQHVRTAVIALANNTFSFADVYNNHIADFGTHFDYYDSRTILR